MSSFDATNGTRGARQPGGALMAWFNKRMAKRIRGGGGKAMGLDPLLLITVGARSGQTRETLGLTGKETFEILGLSDALKPRQELTVVAKAENGTELRFPVTCRIDTPVEVDYYRNGGILPTVLRKLAKG